MDLLSNAMNICLARAEKNSHAPFDFAFQSVLVHA